MIRILGWIILLAALSVGVLWLAEHPGSVDIVWLGYVVRIQVGILISVLFFTLLLLLPIVMLVRHLLGFPSWWRTRKITQSHQKGMHALTQALTALAVSDVQAAARHTRKVADCLGESPLTALLGAQISYRQDDLAGTQKHLKEMLDYAETRAIAARALSSFARQEGNYSAAIAFAKDALKEAPNDLWAYRSLCDLYMREERWQEVEMLIKTSRSKRRISSENAHHLLAVFYHEQAVHAERSGQLEIAYRAAQEANKQDAAFIPAVLLYVKLAGEKGDKRKALTALERGFKAMPHPEYADALIDLCQSESAAKLTKFARNIANTHPQHPESHLLLAVVAIRLAEWEQARQYIKTALALEETARAYKLLAAIENEQYNDRQSAADWLAHAAQTEHEAIWQCGACGHVHKRWQLHCQYCDSFDTIHWDKPKQHQDRRFASFLLGQG